MNPGPHARIVTWLTIMSLILGAVFTIRGLYILGIADGKPTDLALRWREMKYVRAGINPYDISEYLFRKENQLPLAGKPPEIDPQLGGTSCASGYPPWAFFWSLPFIPPVDWSFTRIWFFSLNILSMVFLAGFAWRSTQAPPMQRVFPVACACSMNAIGTTLGNGQWGIILCALLVASILALRKGMIMTPALFFAMSLLKPTFSFTLAAAFRKRSHWNALIIAGALTALAWFLVSWHLSSPPLTMIRQMLEQTARWQDYSYGIADALAGCGIPRSIATLGCLAAGTIAAASLSGRNQRQPVLELAICASLARVFAYHQLYDNVMMFFLVLVSAQLTLKRGRIMDFVILIALLISVWIPGRFTSLFAFQSYQIVVWLCALAWLVKSGFGQIAVAGEANSDSSGSKVCPAS